MAGMIRHKKLLYFFRIWFNLFIKSAFGFGWLLEDESPAIIIGISFEKRSALEFLFDEEGL